MRVLKIWFRFGKKNRLRYVSHLDLQRFMQRALNRTELPIAWSQGFNPHPVMSFASALAMGWTSDYEILEVKMAQDVSVDEAIQAMASALPPDLPVLEARVTNDKSPAPMALLQAADYILRLEGESAPAIAGAIGPYLAEEHVIAMRKTKTGEKEADIRAMTYGLAADPTEPGRFTARLALTERATLKPDLLVRTLAQRAGASEPEDLRVHRVCLLATDASGQFAPLMEFAHA